MSDTLATEMHRALRLFLARKRREARITQVELAAKLKRPQSFVSDLERGERVVDVVLLLELSEAVGFDPHEAIDVLRL